MKETKPHTMAPNTQVPSLYKGGKPIFSLEFFPPKTEEGLETTKALISDLNSQHVDYMTVTYGAGGSTRSNTRRLVSYIHSELKTCAVAHLTCVDHSEAEIDQVLEELLQEGINNILALRGDAPNGVGSFVSHENGFSCARDLVRHLKERKDISILVAGYPEGHKEAQSIESEMSYLKSKIDSGAEVILTQLFFDEQFYFRFVDRARANGISIPIVPGVMPIRDVAQLERFTSLCGSSIPTHLRSSLEKIRHDKCAVVDFGTDFATDMCQKLLKNGAPGIHLYTLNKSNQVKNILQEITL